MKKKINLLFVKLCLLFFCFSIVTIVFPAFSQQISISGKVISSQENTPLPGVSVRIEGAQIGTITDQNGEFNLHANVGSILIISYLGYIPQKVKITSDQQQHLLIQLNQDITSLNPVVVVGYSTEKKENLTGSVSVLDMSTKENQPITNVSNALHGMPGLFVNLSNSMPGVDRATIRIRGIGTLNDNDPLVLVDGIEYSMDELNPNDIESITVLKDASAAIYGSRAANGVILVTTKSGRGKSHVNYNYYYGIQKPTYLPDAIWDPIEYMKLMNQAAINEGKGTPYFTDEEIQQYLQGMKTDPFDYPANNWFDIALRNGIIRKHDLSFSANSDKFQYRLSLGYLNRHGIIFGPCNDERKYSLGLNSSVHITPRLEVGLTLDGYYRYYTEPSYTTDNFWNYLMRTLPIMPDTLKDGSYGYPWLRVPGRNNWEHPRMIAYEGYYRKYVQRFLSTFFSNYQLPWNITYHLKFGIDKYDGLLKIFIPQMIKKQALTGVVMNWNSPSTAPRSENDDYNTLNVHFYNTLDWQHTFGNHYLSALLGSSFDSYDDESFMAQMTGYLDNTLDALIAGTTFLNISGDKTRDVLASYFGRVNYNYSGKYLFEVIFRYDGSSRFAPGHRWGFFPGISAGWRIDKENFFSSLSQTINLLKIRSSFGVLGNQAVPLYSYLNTVTLGHDYSFGGPNGVLASGAAVTTYSDPNISWETTRDYDFGVDIDLLQNRIGFTIDFYKKRTTGILRQVILPDQVGNLTGPQENIGSMDNTGYEITAIHRNNFGGFHYELNGNISYNKNKVIDLNGQILYNYNTNLSTITMAGHPIDAFYLLDAIGIFQSDDEVSKSAYQSADTKAGYIKYRDVNGDGIINGDDRIIIDESSVIPKYTYAFGFNLGYNGFELSAYFQGVAGIKVYPTANLAFPLNNGANATWEWVTDSWSPDRPNAKLPIITESNYGSKINFQPSTFWLRDGSYLRLKNIQLSYALPSKLISRINISKFILFLNAENWFTISRFKEFDPETTVNVSTLYHYPMLKTFTGGFNITF
ncbi:SusC/RagA family TonB-linked outer membrane protein [Thermoflavifilum thermophilum]|uniref:TonB-linked outer membrane protein, SusC/RagA family n=1 Tax=Thermoflavifilum thermophilum TaxID=1393122 RepID=A0A1I7MZA7_9BACT|nr:TonB-dependent receptor [Thermoflavifilum thermophilum]SFV27770.1 TonB-linked outer membrane protein, SusC/RagA family [Thermoflavifilum thermophilum]